MSTRNLDKIFKPQRIAVVGASDAPGKVGYILMHNLICHGFEGVLYPVNPRRESVQGIVAYPSLEALPHTPDLAVICTPASTVPAEVRTCGRLGIGGVVIISAGFREQGDAGRLLENEIRAAVKEFPDVRVVGPNCLGVIVPGHHLNASFAADMPRPGRVALLSQSGALCTAMLDWAIAQEIGFSHFVSLGNLLDVGMDDMLDYLADDPQTAAVILYIESIDEARDFMSAARSFARRKPIVAYKAGRFVESAKAASSHTGALAGVDAVYEAAFQRAGIVRVLDADDMLDCAELLARARGLSGARLAIITNAGGPGVMACDALLAERGTLARLGQQTLSQLNQLLPEFWSHNNPVDVLGDAPPVRFAQALTTVLGDAAVDAVLVILTPQAMTDPTATAIAVAAAASKSDKPVLAAWMGRAQVQAGIAHLESSGVPTYPTPERAVRAFMHLIEFARRREILTETPRSAPHDLAFDHARLRAQIDQITARGGDLLGEEDSKELLELCGICTTRPRPAGTASQAVAEARSMGYPVVLKVLSPQITHKTEVQGVRLNLHCDADVEAAFDAIVANCRKLRPDAEVRGVTVQRMVTAADGVELIVGMKRDPIFGPVIMIGLGGITAELFHDVALELPPLSELLARRMLESLRSWPLLSGYRGRPAMDLNRLVDVLMRFSYLVADLPEMCEADINPLLVTPNEVIALDARVRLDTPRPPGQRPYAHLAICPYPEELARDATLKDGTVVRLRPLRPADELLWIDMVGKFPAELRRILGARNHEVSLRPCFADYDREITLVAEVTTPRGAQFVGAGRLVSDADREVGEFAVVVCEAWQGRGLAGALTDACLGVADQWRLGSVVASVDATASVMTHVLERRGFKAESGERKSRLTLRRQLPLV